MFFFIFHLILVSVFAAAVLLTESFSKAKLAPNIEELNRSETTSTTNSRYSPFHSFFFVCSPWKSILSVNQMQAEIVTSMLVIDWFNFQFYRLFFLHASKFSWIYFPL